MRRLLASSKVLTVAMLLGLFVAWASAERLQYGYPFSLLFEKTCIYIPDEEVPPTMAVFLLALGLASTCAAILIRNHAMARRWMFRILISLLAFGVGELVSARF